MGASGFSAVAFATTLSNTNTSPPPVHQPPCKAWDLISDSLPNSVMIKWRPCENLERPPEHYDYYLYRSTTPNFDVNNNNFLAIKKGNSGIIIPYVVYNDSEAEKGVVYYYKVITVDPNSTLKSPPSEEISGCAGNKLKIKKGFANVSKGEIPEISYRIDNDEPILVKARILDLSSGDIVYETQEEYKCNEEYAFTWEEADKVKNGVYLVEFLTKESNEAEFKVISRERIVIVK